MLYALFKWWLMLEILGIIGMPIVAWLFPALRDRGSSYCRLAGLLLVAYPVWLSSHFGPIFGLPLILISILLVGLLSLACLLADLKAWQEYLNNPREIFLSEVLWLCAFFLLAWIRSYNPEIEGMWKGGGSEKYMDLNFVNSILNSESFPPRDNWLAGYPINYYYYGYYLAAVLIKLTGVLPNVGYNLMVVTVYALAIQGAWGLLRNLGCRWYLALVGIFLAFLAGNPKSVLLFLQGQASDVFYLWKTSRVIDLPTDQTINEYPWFSYLWGDLHGHLSGMPLQMGIVGLCWAALANIRKFFLPRLILGYGFLSLWFGSLAVTNAWDVPGFGAILILSPLCCLTLHEGWMKILKQTFGLLLVGLAAALCGLRLLFIPFFKTFIPPTSGFNLVPASIKTPFSLFLLIFSGILLIMAVPWGIQVINSIKKLLNRETRPTLLRLTPLLFFIVWVVWVLGCYLFTGSIGLILVPALLGLLLCGSGVLAVHELNADDDSAFIRRYPILLLFLALGLILTCEFVVVKDFYGQQSMRMNTIFKFHIQAWVILSLLTAVLSEKFFMLLTDFPIFRRRILLTLQTGILVVVVLLSSLSTWGLLRSKCSNFVHRPTLDGLAFAFEIPSEENQRPRTLHPDDASALLYLLNLQRFEYDPARRILEMHGNPYSTYGRVSTFSGIPTLIAVPNHEGLWNRQKQEVLVVMNERMRDTENIFRASTFEKARPLLEKYQITHVFWGELEQKQFGAAARRKFDRGMKVAQQFGETLIYSGYRDDYQPGSEQSTEALPPPQPFTNCTFVNVEGLSLNQPRGLAVGPDGSLYICNSKAGRVECLSPLGEWIQAYGEPGNQPNTGQLSVEYSGIGGVSVDDNGDVYVADTWNHRIALFTADGTYRREFRADFFGPRNVLVTNQYLIVADTGNHRLVVFQKGTESSQQIGGKGMNLGQFIEPVGLSWYDNRLYVADTGNQRIQILNADFHSIQELPVPGWTDQVGTEPYLTHDPKGNLWATDGIQKQIYQFAKDGRLVGIFGPQSSLGVFYAPKGIVWQNGGLVIAEMGINRLIRREDLGK